MPPKRKNTSGPKGISCQKKQQQQQTTTIKNTGEEGAAFKRLLLHLCVLEMVAPLVLHAKSIDIDKALFCFSELLISFQNIANQKLLDIKLRLKVHLYIIIFLEYRKLLIIRPQAPPPLSPITTCKQKNTSDYENLPPLPSL